MMGTSLVVASEAHPKLYHYSNSVITTVKEPSTPVRGHQSTKSPTLPYKPRAFWVSVDDPDRDGYSWGWADWCKAENFRLEDIKYRHRVVLSDPESLLWIASEAELLDFNEEYGQGQLDSFSSIILWTEVAEKYSGIIIAPYQWEQRLELAWYYGWDCASGCIWDTSIVVRLDPVQHTSRSAP